MLKKTLAILCALTLLVSVLTVGFTASAEATETESCYTVIESEDFENVTLPDDLNYNSTDWYSNTIITKENCYWWTGTQVRLTASFGSTTSIQTRPYFGALRLYVNVESGKTYEFSWRVRDNNADVQGTYVIETRYCNSYDDTSWVAGSVMTTQKTFVGKESFSGWEDNDYTFTATRDAKICLSFGGEDSTQFCFDNFVLKEITHDISAVAAVAPTATTDGVKAHYACTKCGTLYTDAAGTTETTLADLMDRECNVVVNETFDNFSVTSADLVDSGKRFTKNSNGTYWHVYNASGIKLWESGGSYGFTAPSVGYTNAASVTDNGFRLANVTGTTVFYVCFDVVEGRRYTFSFSLWNNPSYTAQDFKLRLRKVTGYDEKTGAPNLDTYYRFVGSSGQDVDFTTSSGHSVVSYDFIASESTTICINMQVYSSTSKYCVMDNFKVEESNHTYAQVPAREANCVYDGNVAHYTCTSCGKNWSDAAYTQYVDPTIPAVEHSHGFENYNLRLDGKIGLGFNATLCDGLTADPTATYAQFAIEGEEGTVEVDLNSAVKEADGSYTFYCPLTSVQMGKEVTATLCYQGNVLGDAITTTANEYIADLEQAEGVDEKVIDLAAATKNYTAFAEKFFADETIEDTVDATVSDTNNFAETDESAAVDFYGYDLVLNDGTDLRLYFKADAMPTFTVGGEAAEAKAYVDGYYYVTISNIAAHELNKKFTVATNDGLTVEVCALSYANSVIKANYNENLVKLCKALYNYSAAAAAYNVQ